MSVSHLLIDTCDVSRVVRVEVGPGRWNDTPTIVQSGTPCRIHILSARERVNAAREEADATHAGFFEPDNDIGREDEITHTEREGVAVAPPVRYRVLARTLPSKAHHVRVTMQEIQAGH